jgi:hypothetical protein
MTHIRRPDKFNGFQWEAYVEDRHAAETAHKYFATEVAALAQAKAWAEEMARTGATVGSAVGASYER